MEAVLWTAAGVTFFSCAGYNAPYLSVYSENAVDVFDVNTMEWIQTIPLKKVWAPPAGIMKNKLISAETVRIAVLSCHV